MIFHTGVHVGETYGRPRPDRGPRRRPAGRRLGDAARPAGAGARAGRRALRHGVPAPAEPPRRRPQFRGRRRSWPMASMSSSSAAAIPGRTASARRSGRARSLSRSSRSCRAPPEKEDKALTWPHWPLKMRTSSSRRPRARSVTFAVDDDRDQAVTTGHVTHIRCARVGPTTSSRSRATEFDLKADLVLLAMGFVHPVQQGLIEDLGVEVDGRKNVAGERAAIMLTSVEKGVQRPATCVAASRWWSGRSARAGRPRTRSTAS